jgi:hypothetical protein
VVSASERLKIFAMDQNSSPDAANENLLGSNEILQAANTNA